MYHIQQKKWYILQTFSGFENRVVKKIKEKIKSNKNQNLFDDIIVPSEQVVEIKNGKKKNSECNFFPGYILIKMHMNEQSWHLVKSVPKIIGFIGGIAEKPTPIQKTEIQKILNKLNAIGNKPRPKVIFKPGEIVHVKHGPFSNFNGLVEDVDYSKQRLKVSVSIFGRPTPVKLNFSQVEKN